MRLRVARAQGVALTGFAAVAVFAGGFFYATSSARSSAVTADKPALAGPTPHWADGYNHFIVTVMAPIPPVAGTSPALSRLKRGDRRPVTPATKAAAGHAVVTGYLSFSPGGSSSSKTGGGQSAPWQSVAPDKNDPIVLRAGQPMSLLPKALAGFPKGTELIRDNEGNLRGVLPPGAHYGHYRASTAAPQVRPVPNGDGGIGGSGSGSGKAKAGAEGTYPPGWGPQSAPIAASLERVPGIHSASPVWGHRFQVATTLTARQLGAVAGIRSVAPNNLLSVTSVPSTNDPDDSQEYYLANVGQSILGQAGTSGASADFSYAWARTRGSGSLIADIDTGVDLNNPDLSGKISPNSEDFSVSPPTTNVQAQGTASGFYHATTVDGVMVAAAGNGWGGAGAAPEATVLALKCGDGSAFTDSCIYAAGEYAITKHVQVINMSFGEQTATDPTLQNLVSDANTAGILVTASAGNWGSDNDKTPVLPAGFTTTYPNVISVGATDNQDQLASFSDYGSTTVDLMAPGTNIYTDYPTYSGYSTAYASGTSYSAPMVAATAALLWSANPSLTDVQVKNDILSSVQSVPALAGQSVTGGRLDAQAALAMVSEPVQFTFTGFDQVAPAQAAQVSVAATAQAGVLPTATPLGYHLELVYNYSGQMYDVVGQSLSWTIGGSAAQTATTGADGTAFIAPVGTNSTNYGASALDLTIPSPGLAAGTYALVAYAAADSTPAQAIGNRQAVFFNVGQASPTPPVTTTTAVPTTTTPATTTTAAGATTTTAAGVTTTTAATTTTLAGATTTTTAGATTTTAATTTSTGAGGTTTTTGSGTTSTTASVPSTTLGQSPMPGVGSATTTIAGATTTTSGATTTTAPSGTTTTTAGGGATTTTAAPTTTTVAGTTTTTAGGATTTTTAPGTTTTAPFSVDSVAPNSLPASGGDISIFGNNLPSNPVVTIGAVNAAVSRATSSEIDIMVGAMTPGTYNVTVYNANQSQHASLANAVTIDGSGGTTTTTAGGGTTTTAAGATTTTAAATTTTAAATTTTVAGTTTTTAGATTTTAAATTTTSATTTTAPTTTTTLAGGNVVGPNGMVLAPVSGSNPLSAVPVGEWPAFTASQVLADNGQSAGTAVDGVDV